MTGQALAFAPDDMVAHHLHGRALLGLDRPREAVGHFEQTIAAAPWFDEAHRLHGRALHQSGRTMAGRRSVGRALELAPDSSANLLAAIEMDQKLYRWARARANIDRALTLEPENPQAHVAAALNCLRYRDRYRAWTHLRTALELDPENTNALNLLGMMEDRDDNPERALRLFEQSSRIDARNGGPELHRRTSSKLHRIWVSRHTGWVIFCVLSVLSGIGWIATMPERDVYQPAPTTFTLPEPSKVPVSGPPIVVCRGGDLAARLQCTRDYMQQQRLERREFEANRFGQAQNTVPTTTSTTSTTGPNGG